MNDSPTWVAEISANHMGSFERAKSLIEAAAQSGATAVKLQTYRPETMVLNSPRFSISSGHPLWGGRKLFDLYAEAMTPWEWHQELFEIARIMGLIPFSSPFDRSAVDFLENLDCPIYKIASMETGDLDLIQYVAQTKKPIIMSTGATELIEIEKAVEVALHNGCNQLTLLVCTSSYPSDPQDSHIRRIDTLRDKFNLPIGLSDHTLGIGVAIAAVARGAVIIEKHLTQKRSDGGPDGAFSMEPAEFALMVQEGNIAHVALGDPHWKISKSEEESRNLRRSLYITENVKKGEIATQQNVKCLRPNQGGNIINLPKILNRPFNNDYQAGTPATLDCVQ